MFKTTAILYGNQHTYGDTMYSIRPKSILIFCACIPLKVAM